MRAMLIKPIQNLLWICLILLFVLPAGARSVSPAAAQAGKSDEKMRTKMHALELLGQMQKTGTVTDAKRLIESALGLVDETYKTGTIDYQRVLDDVTKDMEQAMAACPTRGTIKQFWYNVRFNEVVDKAQMDIEGYVTEMNNFLRKNAGSIMRGAVFAYPGWGQMKKYRQRHIILRNTGSNAGWVFLIANNNGNYNPFRFFYVDKQGTKNIWELDDGRYRLTYTRRLVRFAVNGTVMAAHTLIPTVPKGPRTVAVPYKGKMYAVTLDAANKTLAAEPVQLEKQPAQGNSVTSKVPSLQVKKKKVTAVNPGDTVTHFPSVSDAGRQKIGRLFRRHGMPGDSADILCNNLIKNGDSIYVTGAGYFKGTLKDLRKGNYSSGTFNANDDGTHLTLFTRYKKHKMQRVECSDGSVYYDFKDNRFSVLFPYSNDELNRDYLSMYNSDGTPAASRLKIKDMGTDIHFDAGGTMTPKGWSNLTGLQHYKMNSDGNIPINYRAIPMENMRFDINPSRQVDILACGYKGIELINTKNNSKEVYSQGGHRVVGANPFLIQTLVRFPDLRYRRKLVLPKINSPQGCTLIANMTLNYFTGVLYTDLTGQLHLNVTQSSALGTVMKTWEKLYKPPAVKKQ